MFMLRSIGAFLDTLLDNDNRMDETPFFQFSMQECTDAEAMRLEMFAKSLFSIDEIVSEAKKVRMVQAVKELLAGELSNPSEEFAKEPLNNVIQVTYNSSWGLSVT